MDKPDESGTVYTVHVQRPDPEQTVDTYTVEDGQVPSIQSTSDRELIISKRAPDGDAEQFVVMYAQGHWLRVWCTEE